MKNFGHAFYFSKDLPLPPSHTYFLIDFKEVSSTILAKVGGRPIASHTPVVMPLLVNALDNRLTK